MDEPITQNQETSSPVQSAPPAGGPATEPVSPPVETPPAVPADPKAKMKKWIKVGLAVALILALANGYIYYRRKTTVSNISAQVAENNKLIEQIRSKRAQNTERNYQNNDLKFSIKFPSTWQYDVCGEGDSGIVTFGMTEDMLFCNSDAFPGGYITVQVYPGAELGQIILTAMANLEGAVKEDITLDGKPAARISGTTMPLEGPSLPPGMKQILVMTYSAGRIYNVMYLNHEEKNYEAEFNKAVASFKFLP
jgi:hypothetical protein